MIQTTEFRLKNRWISSYSRDAAPQMDLLFTRRTEIWNLTIITKKLIEKYTTKRTFNARLLRQFSYASNHRVKSLIKEWFIELQDG